MDTKLRRGDVVVCDLSPAIGTEQGGIRPAVIVQMDYANASSPHTIIVPFTSKLSRSLFASHVFVPGGVAGLVQDSVILCEQIKVLDKRRVTRNLGALPDELMVQLDEALIYILGIKFSL